MTNTKSGSRQKQGTIIKALLLLVILLSTGGCFLTKVVSVPMRLGGAVISVIPVAGNSAHAAIDEGADIVDEIPL